MVNLFSMFHPNGWTLVTPAELQIYGWTTVDLWLAPLITALMAFLMQAQPFWVNAHVTLMGLLRPMLTSGWEGDLAKPWSIDDARSFSACIIWVLFAARTTNNFGIAWWNTKPKRKEVMRSSMHTFFLALIFELTSDPLEVDGRRYHGSTKKTQ
jgi:hypothetical protein